MNKKPTSPAVDPNQPPTTLGLSMKNSERGTIMTAACSVFLPMVFMAAIAPRLRFARKKQTNTCRFQIPERSHCHQLHATGSNDNGFFRQLPLCCTEEQACSTCMSFRFFAVFVLFRETRRLWENWLIAKAAFPSPPTIVSSDGS